MTGSSSDSDGSIESGASSAAGTQTPSPHKRRRAPTLPRVSLTPEQRQAAEDLKEAKRRVKIDLVRCPITPQEEYMWERIEKLLIMGKLLEIEREREQTSIRGRLVPPIPPQEVSTPSSKFGEVMSATLKAAGKATGQFFKFLGVSLAYGLYRMLRAPFVLVGSLFWMTVAFNPLTLLIVGLATAFKLIFPGEVIYSHRNEVGAFRRSPLSFFDQMPDFLLNRLLGYAASKEAQSELAYSERSGWITFKDVVKAHAIEGFWTLMLAASAAGGTGLYTLLFASVSTPLVPAIAAAFNFLPSLQLLLLPAVGITLSALGTALGVTVFTSLAKGFSTEKIVEPPAFEDLFQRDAIDENQSSAEKWHNKNADYFASRSDSLIKSIKNTFKHDTDTLLVDIKLKNAL